MDRRCSCHSNGNAFAGEVLLRVGDGVLAVMKNTCREDRVGFAIQKHLGHVFERTAATTGNYRHTDGLADATSDWNVEPPARAVGVDAVEDNLACPEQDRALCPLDRFEASAFAS